MDGSGGKIGILVVGSLPPPLGGCTVTLQHLVEELRTRRDVEVVVVDTKGIRGGGLGGARRLLAVMKELLRLAPAADVVTLHAATSALPHWGVIVLTVARLAHRPFVLRKFASTDYRHLGRVRGRIAHGVAAAASVFFVETRELVARSRERGLTRAHWFPNARPLPSGPAPTARGGPCRRFVFVGQVRREKGLVELVEAMTGVPEGVTVDVFGPRFDDLPSDLFDGHRGVAYRGTLQPHEVAARISTYDALVLPTLWKHEGYPGVVLEAYAAGLPVVASRIGGIPEILDEHVGVLVDPGDVGGLRRAMTRLATDADACAILRANARARAEAFSTRRWADEFVERCRAAMAARGVTACR
jgi:glycosyltransferase involved in cell wall biosynthesis